MRALRIESARVAFLLTCPAPTPWGRTRSGPCYIDELLPDVHEGRIEPGRVFDQVTNLEGVPDGYRAVNEREAIKVLIEL
jgi:threonine dehydrogenase-like Zn-dependent dehydrogenase